MLTCIVFLPSASTRVESQRVLFIFKFIQITCLYKLWYLGWDFSFYLSMGCNCSSTICWKGFLSFTECFFTFVKNQLGKLVWFISVSPFTACVTLIKLLAGTDGRAPTCHFSTLLICSKNHQGNIFLRIIQISYPQNGKYMHQRSSWVLIRI